MIRTYDNLIKRLIINLNPRKFTTKYNCHQNIFKDISITYNHSASNRKYLLNNFNKISNFNFSRYDTLTNQDIKTKLKSKFKESIYYTYIIYNP